MQIISNTFDILSAPLSPSHFLLDIETTGLSKTNDTIICIGVLYKSSASQINSVQWFAESSHEECTILELFLEFCSSYKAVYTYNGKSFDISFIISRLAHYSLLDDIFKKLSFIDMKKVFSIISTKRLSIEHQLAYQRKATVTGKELVTLYSLFVSTRLLAYQTVILNHNTDELCSLLAMYEAYFVIYHLPTYQYLDTHIKDCHMSIHLEADFSFHTACSIIVSDIGLSWHKHTNLITLQVSLYKGVFKKYLSPYKDYYFIENQSQLIHKSVAKFIPKELKQKVTPKQCYIVKASTFVKLYTSSKAYSDIWYNDNAEPFIEYEEGKKLVSFILYQVSQLLIYS